MHLKNFINFHLDNLIFDPVVPPEGALIDKAFAETVADMRYHFPAMSSDRVDQEIVCNNGALPVFLYRLVRCMHIQGYDDKSKYQIHFMMKSLCGSEIYWDAAIDQGLLLVHGSGTVIGSRIKIGKGFRIYHGCTVGHKELKGYHRGPRIGNDVILFANAQVLGAIEIGDNVTIGANALVINSVESNQIVGGIPAMEIKAL